MIETWNKIHSGLAMLTWKQITLIGVPGGSSLAALIEQLLTGSWTSAGVAGAIGAVLMTVALTVPRVMEQRRMGRVSQADIEDKAIARMGKIMSEQADFFREQLASKDRQSSFYRTVAVERDLIATLENRSKHAVLTELNVASMLLRDNDKFNYKTYDEMVGQFDEQIQQAKERIRDAGFFDGLTSPMILQKKADKNKTNA